MFTDERILSRPFTHESTATSSDLTPVDFWPRSYVKSRVFHNSPSSLVELKNAIRHEFSCIEADMLHAEVNGVITR